MVRIPKQFALLEEETKMEPTIDGLEYARYKFKTKRGINSGLIDGFGGGGGGGRNGTEMKVPSGGIKMKPVKGITSLIKSEKETKMHPNSITGYVEEQKSEELIDEDTTHLVSSEDEKAKLIELSGEKADNYKAVLESLGYFTELKAFNVDSRGNSPELREELGKDYLENRVIIASEEQIKEQYLLDCSSSYMKSVISQISEELVNTINPYEALAGQVNLLHGSSSIISLFDTDFKNYPSSKEGLHASLVLDTLTKAVRKMDFLNSKISLIKESNLKTLETNFVNNILSEIHPLTTKYGSIEHVKGLNTVVDVPISDEMVNFKHKGHEIFLFNVSEPFLIYRGMKKRKKPDFPMEILHSSSESKVVDHLIKANFLKIKKENIFGSLKNMAKSVLEERVPDCSNLKGFHFYKIFKQHKEDSGIQAKLKDVDWYLLRDTYYGKVEFSSLPLEFKQMITIPRDDAVKSFLGLLNGKIS